MEWSYKLFIQLTHDIETTNSPVYIHVCVYELKYKKNNNTNHKM